MGKRVAIVGAGASGLSAIKCCLEEGLEPVCFEKTGSIGGLWYYTEEVRPDQACVMKSTVINTSKEVMCFSDFPIPADNPVFMHNSKVLQYFNDYAEAFHLIPHIQFSTEVTWVEQAQDFSESGQWKVTVKGQGYDEITQHFDGVILCTGHHAKKCVPDFPGAERFKGRTLHTSEYKRTRGFEDLRVLIVGCGTSAGEAAVELSKVTSKVYLSTRRGTWVVNKMGDKGLPADLSLATRFGIDMAKWMGPEKLNNMVEKQLNEKFDHQLYGLKPKHRFSAQHPMVNDELPHRIACGSIDIKPNVESLSEHSVQFVDGTTEDIDVILYATGYLIKFPFLDKKVLDIQDNVVELYKYIFPPDLCPSTLAVVGLVQPLGSTISMAEMQNRWAARVLKGECKLPDSDAMWADILRKQTEIAARYVHSQRHTIQVDWIPYMDEIADKIGCRPNIRSTMLRDPQLACQLYFGPCTPLHYRLSGPGKWQGARQAILSTWDRVYAPLKGRPTSKPRNTKAWLWFVLAVVMAVFIRMWLS